MLEGWKGVRGVWRGGGVEGGVEGWRGGGEGWRKGGVGRICRDLFTLGILTY